MIKVAENIEYFHMFNQLEQLICLQISIIPTSEAPTQQTNSGLYPIGKNLKVPNI